MNIDEELQAALEVDPSPEFVARVRMRVAEEPSPRRSWSLWWLAVSAPTAVAALIAAAVLVPRSPTPAAPGADRLASRPLPMVGAIAPPARVFQVREGGTGVARASQARKSGSAVAPAVQARAEVLVDARESRTLRRLMFGQPLNIERPYVGSDLTAIEIVPIAIEALPPSSEGVHQ